jgi:hypothetical protein
MHGRCGSNYRAKLECKLWISNILIIIVFSRKIKIQPDANEIIYR